MNPLISPVPDGWQEMLLGKVCDVVAGPSNSVIRPVKTGGVPIDVVAPKHLQDGRITGSDTVMVEPIPSTRLERYRIGPGDLICVRTGDLGKRSLADSAQAGWVVGTGCFRLHPKSTIEPRYLLHYLGHPAVRDWIARHASTATVPTLTQNMLGALPVLVPPLTTQATIGDIMSALDNKAALHREIVAVTEKLRDSLFPLLLTDR